ncbi:MAG: hypothetical protein RSP_14710 [Rhodanobacter sp.]
MAKFDDGHMSHASFNAIKDVLVAKLANVIEAQLIAMGDDAKGISWFSSCAEEYVCTRVLRAA